MIDKFSMEELIPVITEVVASGGEFLLYPRGTSMLPLLREGKDAVVLTAPASVCVSDIVLYRRTGGQYVLHRVIGKKDGNCVLCGDNQYQPEMGIAPEQIVAKVCRICRDGKETPVTDPAYRRYVAGRKFVRLKRRVRSFLAGKKRKWAGR